MDDAGRYRLTLVLDDRRVMDGWWGREATGRKKFAATVGDYGRDGARITLVDTETDEELAAWPKPATSSTP
ncbi:hypothetical protein ACGFYM_40605 [Streptomyces sp. NPDC048231]|uniref:hypothetical protein n=1 Tax=Streptomyces sp. NPDC048231 TaxID=3365519 RepID=UPI003720A9ED